MKQEHVLRVNNLKLKPDHSKEQLLLMLKKTLGLKNEYQIEYDVVKRSIDARHKPYIMYVYSVDVKKISKNGNNIDLKKFLIQLDLSANPIHLFPNMDFCLP